MEILNIDRNDLQARTELSKIYQHQNKYEDAEKILLEIFNIDKENCYAMAELIKVYFKKQNPEECFVIFDTFLSKCNLGKKRKREPQAMFNNIFKLCSIIRRNDKAKDYFDKYGYLLDQRNIELYKRYFR